MHRAFIFDFDDTLVETKKCKFEAIKAVSARYYSHHLDDTEIELHWGKPFEELFKSLFKALDSNLPRVIERYFTVTQQYPMSAFEGAAETLNQLSATKAVGIVTAASRKFVIPDLIRLGFSIDTFAFIQCAEDSEFHKPDPRVFEPVKRMLVGLGIRLEETLYIGDTFGDYVASIGAGLCFIGLTHSDGRANPFEGRGISTIGSVKELSTSLAR